MAAGLPRAAEALSGYRSTPLDVTARVVALLHGDGQSSAATHRVVSRLNGHFGTDHRAVEDPRTRPEAIEHAVSAAESLPPSGVWLFTLACAVGAMSLAVIFGAFQPWALALIAVTAGLLAAVCPAMVLVPGPHVLNGCLDLADRRVDLGLARLVYATMVILGISAGLLTGLGLGQTSLPVTAVSAAAPQWSDALAAAVVAACYAVFFSLPVRSIGWTVVIAAVAHTVRWMTISQLHWSAALGTFYARLVVGLALIPISAREHRPFAGIGFAAVVSMVPGVYLFRGAAGVLALAGGDSTLGTVSGTLSDLPTAVLIVLAMAVGLLLPGHIFD
ncbi:threonine/serine exporter family protein [Arsenicicoccus piscis]|uniref:Threonine/serine exporter-like N-terminal domain-containing protein n=1 Tax=Arsenicicoccus piscis TaxID=673954 RepID=A0ABQ6HMD0_9MICO|nr:threonine/serine exporter family protein [Arsenicicoccus piscis]GMA19618.1 hypothetical protein GCM10025862_16390 [Arsenicicoccus piscis]